jgi:DNA-binding PadR family transcriptional regulator
MSVPLSVAAPPTITGRRRGVEGLRGIDIGYIFPLLMRGLFLALLAGDRGHGYELKQTLEQEFGERFPALNAGQIYSTLARLERDGLVVGQSVAGDSRRKRVYELTESGRAALQGWIETPVPGTRLKDEFFMKFVVVASAGLAEPRALIDGQRREYLQSLRDLDAQLSANGNGLAAELLVEGAVLHLKADLEWLDLIEHRMTVRKEST